jgi:hypothetical protein
MIDCAARNGKLTAVALFLRAKAEAEMEMDKTLKILLACLGVAGFAVLVIPNGDPLAKSSITPLAPANPAVSQPAPLEQAQSPQNPGRVVAAPQYTPPSSDQNPVGQVDSATLQQQTFGQPMFDPRPASERNVAPEGTQSPAPAGQSQSGYAPPPPTSDSNTGSDEE